MTQNVPDANGLRLARAAYEAYWKDTKAAVPFSRLTPKGQHTWKEVARAVLVEAREAKK
jgi:hypothetical protein